MKSVLKILKDETGRQIEGMILVAGAGIIVAIAAPQIAHFFGLSAWLSLLLAVVGVLGLFIILVVIPSSIGQSQERKREGIHLWNPETGKTVLELGEDQAVYSLAFSPDGNILAYCGSQSMVCMETATGKKLYEEESYFDQDCAVVFSRDGNFLAAAGGNSICMWKANSWKEILDVNVEDEISSLAFSHDGDLLASDHGYNTTLLLRVSNDIKTFRFEGHESPVFCTAFSPDSKLIASGGHNGVVRIWTVDSGKLVKCLSGTECPYSVAFSPDGRFLAIGRGDGLILVWEITTGKELMRLKGHKKGIEAVTFSPDGKLLCSGGDDCAIRIWDIASKSLSIKLKANLGKIHAVAFSPDGHLLASGSETPW